jgi:hypothetical protein
MGRRGPTDKGISESQPYRMPGGGINKERNK